jgi:hypothetical protein
LRRTAESHGPLGAIPTFRSRFASRHREEIVIPSSLPVIVATAALTLLAAFVLAWGFWRGFFRDLDAQSRVICEPDDFRIERPWETPVERLERETRYGAPVTPAPGEWGGAA